MTLLHRLSTCTLVCLACIGLCCAAPASAEEIRIGGAGAALGMMKLVAEAFEKENPGLKVIILPSLGSSGGIKALLHDALDLAVSGRPLTAEEIKRGARAAECGRTPFLFVVNKSVAKTDITPRELEMVYRGSLTAWPDGSRIRPILRPAGDTDTAIVKGISKGVAEALDAAIRRQDMTMAVTDQEAAEAVTRIPGALTGATLAQVETEHLQVRMLSFNGIRPSLESLARGTYPLAKPLYLVSTPRSSAAAQRLISFVRSPPGRAILKRSGTLPP